MQTSSNINQNKNLIVYSILANMNSIDIDTVNKIMQSIGYTRFAQFESIFSYCRDYYNDMNKMPDAEYLNIQFDNMLNVQYPIFHKNYIQEFLKLIEAEATSTKTHSLMLQGKFGDAATLLNKFSSKNSVKPLLGAADVVKMYRQFRKDFNHGLKTDILEYDEVVDFYMYKTLNVIVAPSSNFKTTIGCSISYSGIFNQGLKVAYLTLEDDSMIIWYNFLARHSYELNKAMTGNELKKYLITDDRMHLLDEVAEDWDKSKKGDLVIISANEIGAFTPMNIVAALNDAEEKMSGLDVVVVDHFNIMSDPVPGMRLSKVETFSYYVRFMTNLSITFNDKGFILVGLSQTNRDGTSTFNKGKDMDTTQIADTSELERSATVVTSAFADDQLRAQNKLKMKIIKNRLGEKGGIFLPSVKPEYFKVGDTLPRHLVSDKDINKALLQVAPASTLMGV